MWIMLFPILLMGGGFAAWMFFFKDKVIGAAHANWAAAQAEFDANEPAILGKYWNDPNRFKMLKDAVPGETIVGISNAGIPKTTGEKLMTGLKEAVTNTITFDMGASYFILTDGNLHFAKFDGATLIEHRSFALSALKGVRLESDGQTHKLGFTADGEQHLFNVSGTFSGYPRFEVDRNLMKDVLAHEGDRSNPFERKYFANDDELGERSGTIDMIVRRKYSKGFIDDMQRRFPVRWPDAFQI